MKDFVSHHWMGVSGLLVAAALACALLAPYGFPWAALAGFSLVSVVAVLSVMGWKTARTGRQLTDILHDVDGEPVPVPASSPRGQSGAQG